MPASWRSASLLNLVLREHDLRLPPRLWVRSALRRRERREGRGHRIPFNPNVERLLERERHPIRDRIGLESAHVRSCNAAANEHPASGGNDMHVEVAARKESLTCFGENA